MSGTDAVAVQHDIEALLTPHGQSVEAPRQGEPQQVEIAVEQAGDREIRLADVGR